MHIKLHYADFIYNIIYIWITDLSLKLTRLRREIHYKVGITDTTSIVLQCIVHKQYS